MKGKCESVERARDRSSHLDDQLGSKSYADLRFGPGPSLGSWGIGDHLPHTERTTPIPNGKPRTSSPASDSPVSEHQPYAMPISIPAFLSCLLLIGSVRAQVSAPNCTDNTFSWVGSAPSDARFVSITIRYSLRAGIVIDVQLSQTKSLLGHGLPVVVVQQRQSVEAPLVHHRRSY